MLADRPRGSSAGPSTTLGPLVANNDSGKQISDIRALVSEGA